MTEENTSKEVTFSMTVTPTDQTLADIVITAIEGGVNYWATCAEYRWENLPPSEVFAVIEDIEDETKQYRVTVDTVREGLRRLVSGECKIHLPETDEPIRAMTRGILLDPDYDYDAGDADNIVQAGLFNEVRYG